MPRNMYLEERSRLSNGSRIVNLNKLQEHLHIITQHAATSRLCTKEALSAHETVVLVGEQHLHGFCSILASCCAECKEEFNFPTSAKVKPTSGGKYYEDCCLGPDGYGRRRCTTNRNNGCNGHTCNDEEVLHCH